ncbi:MAG: peptidase lon domain protein [Frankiales bacterium]|nr:peptidase lon domain protein [Frankiales bacterium]
MAPPETERLPLFPLGLVLFPGLLLPLHVFEERYRVLVRDLLALPGPQQRFGVVAIREGREVGEDGVRALHDVGCVARLQRAEAYPDGRYDVVAVGAERFRLHELGHERPYLTGQVQVLAEESAAGDAEPGLLRTAVAQAYADYLTALEEAGADEVATGEVPMDPAAASYLVAATVLLDLQERQALLESPDTTARLRQELRLLRREATLLRTLTAVPSPSLTRTPLSLN